MEMQRQLDPAGRGHAILIRPCAEIMNNSEPHPSASNKRRVFLVEDHPVTRQGLCLLVDREADLIVCGQAGASVPALQGIQSSRPDVAVIDIAIPGRDGIELIRDIGEHHPRLPTLVLSAMDEGIYAKRALQAGAKGYVMKHEPVDHFMMAVREVLAGEVYLSPAMRTQILLASLNLSDPDPKLGVKLLSDRELEIFRLIGEGFGTQKIAKNLNLSISTVETHRAHIKEKLGVKYAPDLVREAVIWLQSQNVRH
jgi:DNA-binding NarL/FixJ family response regulator